MKRFACLAVLLASCGGSGAEGNRRDVDLRDFVCVTSGPAALVAEVALGPERVDAIGGASDRDWRPTDADLDRLLSAKRVLLLGLENEPWAQRAGLPPSRTLELASLVDDSQVIRTAVVEHTHGRGPAHSHGGTIREAWADPTLLRVMVHGAAEHLAGSFEGDDPGAVERRRTFEEAIEGYAAELTAAGEALGDLRLLVAGDGFEYAARAGGLDVEVVQITRDDGEPNDIGLERLTKHSKDAAFAKVLVWPHAVDDELAERIQRLLGLESVRFDLGLSPEGGASTLDVLADSAARLNAALRRDR